MLHDDTSKRNISSCAKLFAENVTCTYSVQVTCLADKNQIVRYVLLHLQLWFANKSQLSLAIKEPLWVQIQIKLENWQNMVSYQTYLKQKHIYDNEVVWLLSKRVVSCRIYVLNLSPAEKLKCQLFISIELEIFGKLQPHQSKHIAWYSLQLLIIHWNGDDNPYKK